MIKLLHGADLHLDSPFSSYSPGQGAQYRALQRRLPGMITRLANERGCDLLVLSGDILDSEEVHPETVQALHDAFAQFRGHVFIAPGNHDPYTDVSVWAQCDWPGNVHVFKTEYECVVLESLGCCIHGGAFLSPVCYVALPQVTQQGYTQIGVFHADAVTASEYRMITREQIAGSGFDYLALGHIHKRKMPEKLGSTWYGWPGVAMGRGFDELGPCGVLEVTLKEGSCTAEFLPLETPVYEIITVPAYEEPDIPEHSHRCHCRMRFVGSREPLDPQAVVEAYGEKFLSLEVRDETEPLPDLWEACGDGTLRGLALDALREEKDADLAAFAARYLLAALEGREEP